MKLSSRDERALIRFFLLTTTPLLSLLSPFHAFAMFFAWPLVLGYSAYSVLGLSAIYNGKPVFAWIALAALLSTHIIFRVMVVPIVLLLEIPAVLALVLWLVRTRKSARGSA
jgi:hypothetical protein